MQSEGPYEHKKYPIAGGGKKHSHLCPACAYAEGRKAAEKYTEKMLVFAKDEVRKCHEEIRRLEDKYARNVYKMPGSLENELEEKKVKTANLMADRIICGLSCADVVKDFKAWKKARGIE